MGETSYGEGVYEPYSDEIDYIIERLESKFNVTEVTRLNVQILEVERDIPYSPLTIFLVDAYVLGEGATLEIIESNPTINTIVVTSSWNQYTSKAKELAKDYNVAVFTYNELMGAVEYDGKSYIDYQS
jgi:hypothetical protein